MKSRKKEQKEMEQTPNPATLDHLIASYVMQGSYSEPILLTPSPQGEYIYIFRDLSFAAKSGMLKGMVGQQYYMVP